MLQGLNNNVGYQVRTCTPDIQNVVNYKTYNALSHNRRGISSSYRQEIDLGMSSHDGVQQGAGVKQSGQGVFADAVDMFKENVSRVGRIYDSEPMNDLRNSYGRWANSNPNWRAGYAGERHMIDPSTGVTYNYLGPHTHLNERLARGDPPLDGPMGVDAIAKDHDIEYNQARTSRDIRNADRKFVNRINSSQGNKTAKFIAKNAIKAKMKMEDMGVAKAQDFTSLPNIVQDNKPNSMRMDDNKAAMPGKGKKDPAKKLKDKIMRLKKKKLNKMLRNI